LEWNINEITSLEAGIRTGFVVEEAPEAVRLVALPPRVHGVV
jgi:hypothetical protein